MTMVEFSESVNQTYHDYMMFMTRWTSLMEAVDGELQENLDQARLKVLNENGNDEDLIYLEEAAEDSAFQKFKAAMKKLWDKVISTIKSIQTKIVDFFTIDKEKKMKDIANSELGNQKIDCPDYQEIEKAEKEYKHVIQKWTARFKSGQNPDVEELDDAKKKYQSRKEFKAKNNALNQGGEVQNSRMWLNQFIGGKVNIDTKTDMVFSQNYFINGATYTLNENSSVDFKIHEFDNISNL